MTVAIAIVVGHILGRSSCSIGSSGASIIIVLWLLVEVMQLPVLVVV